MKQIPEGSLRLPERVKNGRTVVPGETRASFSLFISCISRNKNNLPKRKTKLNNNNKQTENLLVLGLDLGGVMARVLSEYGQGMLHEILEELIAYLLIV